MKALMHIVDTEVCHGNTIVGTAWPRALWIKKNFKRTSLTALTSKNIIDIIDIKEQRRHGGVPGEDYSGDCVAEGAVISGRDNFHDDMIISISYIMYDQQRIIIIIIVDTEVCQGKTIVGTAWPRALLTKKTSKEHH